MRIARGSLPQQILANPPAEQRFLALTPHDIERMTRNSTLIISQSN